MTMSTVNLRMSAVMMMMTQLRKYNLQSKTNHTQLQYKATTRKAMKNKSFLNRKNRQQNNALIYTQEYPGKTYRVNTHPKG